MICARCKRGYKSEEDIENREGFDLREDSDYTVMRGKPFQRSLRRYCAEYGVDLTVQ